MRFRSRRELNMSCLRVIRVLQAYLDGEVDESTARLVSVHLADCGRCGMRADTYRAIKAAMARRGPGWDDDTCQRFERFARQVARSDPDRI